MTLPNERSNSVLNVRDFLRALLDIHTAPWLPEQVRLQVYYLLKHFPSSLDVHSAAKASPDIFGEVDLDHYLDWKRPNPMADTLRYMNKRHNTKTKHKAKKLPTKTKKKRPTAKRQLKEKA